jgi:hypothetical protein
MLIRSEIMLENGNSSAEVEITQGRGHELDTTQGALDQGGKKKKAPTPRLPRRFAVYDPEEAHRGHVAVKKRWLYMPKSTAAMNELEHAKYVSVGYDAKNSELGFVFFDEKPTNPSIKVMKIKYLNTNLGTDVSKSDRNKYKYSVSLDGIIRQHNLKFRRGTTVLRLVKGNDTYSFFTVDITDPIRVVFSPPKEEKAARYSAIIAEYEQKIRERDEAIAKLAAMNNAKYAPRIEKLEKAKQFWQKRLENTEGRKSRVDTMLAKKAEKQAMKEKAGPVKKLAGVIVPALPLPASGESIQVP